MRRIARTDPVVRFNLLSIKGDDNHCPILPLPTDNPEALRYSPIYALVDPNDDLTQVASNFKGPGPWMLHQNLKLPGTCAQMKFTNRNRKSNIIVTHTLKLVMRVERGDDFFMDPKTGRRKLFDIVVQTPVIILSASFFFLFLLFMVNLTFSDSVDVIQNGLLFRDIQKSWIIPSLFYQIVHVALHIPTTAITSLAVLLQRKLSSQVIHLILVHQLRKLVL